MNKQFKKFLNEYDNSEKYYLDERDLINSGGDPLNYSSPIPCCCVYKKASGLKRYYWAKIKNIYENDENADKYYENLRIISYNLETFTAAYITNEKGLIFLNVLAPSNNYKFIIDFNFDEILRNSKYYNLKTENIDDFKLLYELLDNEKEREKIINYYFKRKENKK